jgi:hypothetical protein
LLTAPERCSDVPHHSLSVHSQFPIYSLPCEIAPCRGGHFMENLLIFKKMLAKKEFIHYNFI